MNVKMDGNRVLNLILTLAVSIAAAAGVVVFIGIAGCAGTPGARKGTFVRTIWHRPDEQSEEEVTRTLRRCVAAGFDRVVVEAIVEGTTFYPGNIYEIREGFEKFDAVSAFIQIGHASKLQIDVAAQIFLAGTQDSAIVKKHPEWLLRDVRRSAASIFEPAPEGGAHYWDPANADARELIVSGIAELMQKDPDGLHLAEVRRPPSRTTGGRSQYYDGVSPGAPPPPSLEEPLVSLVKRIRDSYPKTRLSAGVDPLIERARLECSQDWSRFAVDEFIFQSFVTSPRDMEALLLQINTRRPYLLGIAAFEHLSPPTLVRMEQVVNRSKARGAVYHSLQFLDDQALGILKINAFFGR